VGKLKAGLLLYAVGGYLFSQAVTAGGTLTGWILCPVSLLLLVIGAHFVALGVEEITRRKR
jgi:hypothetical protein